MSEAPSETPTEFINVPCPSCGAEMAFDPSHQGLSCHHCGHTMPIPKEDDLVMEQSLASASNLSEQATGFDAPTKTFHCNNCGANTAVPVDLVHFTCSFCGSKNVNEGAYEQKMIRPFGILPFKVSKEKALESFRNWIQKGKLFRPGKLRKLASLKKIHGVYLPFWTYDAQTQSRWTAQAGYHYYETETYTDSEGNTKTRQVQRTRWVPVSGYHEKFFDDVLVVASTGLSQGALKGIEPFDLKDVNNYDSRFILGYESEVYQKDVQEGFEVADNIMDDRIRSEVVRQIPGDTHRMLNVRTRKSGITFKHLLLPVWMAAYQFNNKTYRFTVNGQTGKISGKKPVAWGRVILAVLIVAAIIAAIVFFTQSGEASYESDY